MGWRTLERGLRRSGDHDDPRSIDQGARSGRCDATAVRAERGSHGHSLDTDSALSAELFLSSKTIEAHGRSIFSKVNLRADASDHRRVLAVLAFLRS